MILVIIIISLLIYGFFIDLVGGSYNVELANHTPFEFDLSYFAPDELAERKRQAASSTDHDRGIQYEHHHRHEEEEAKDESGEEISTKLDNIQVVDTTTDHSHTIGADLSSSLIV